MNREGVESLKETDDVVTITMSAEWSKNCDGVKLFGLSMILVERSI